MIGQTVSHYRILEKLGEGGMGIVYLAEDTHLGRRVAIKFLTTARDNHHYRARFLQEARSASALSHPHIAAIYDYGETSDNQPFIVIELVEGRTLADLMQGGELTIARAIEIIADVAEALTEAHQHQIIHRDIKPANIAVNNRQQVKVLDFGLAKQLNEDFLPAASPDAQTLLATRTREGTVIGTPLYISPEQARGDKIDTRSDLFSLGSVLYELICGRPAFYGAGVIEICAQVLHIEPPTPSSVNPLISPELNRVTLKALAKNPDQRYQSASEMAEALRTLRQHLPHPEQQIRTQILPSQAGTSKIKQLATLTNRLHLSHPTPRRLAVLTLGLFLLTLSLWFKFGRIHAGQRPPTPQAQYWFRIGESAMRDGTYFNASKAFLNAVNADEKYAPAHARLAEAFMELDQEEKAAYEIATARSLVPDLSSLPVLEALTLQAINKSVVRNPDGAIEDYRKIVEAITDQEHAAAAYVDLGRAYEANEEISHAIECYRRATELNHQSASAFLRLGILYGRQQNLALTTEAFSQAEQLYQDMANFEGLTEVLYQRGFYLNLLGKPDEAQQALEKALKIAQTTNSLSQQIKIRLQISSVECLTGRTAEARQTAQTALELAQSENLENLTVQGLINLGSAFFLAGERDEAEKKFVKAIELAQKYKLHRAQMKALINLGSLLINSGETERGMAQVTEALKFYQAGNYRRETLLAQHLIGLAQRQKGDFEAATQAFTDRLRLSIEMNDLAQESLSREGLGVNFLFQEHYPEALEQFEKSLAISRALKDQSGVGYGLLNCGAALSKLGRNDSAREMFRQTQPLTAEQGGYQALRLSVIMALAQMSLTERNFDEAYKQGQAALRIIQPNDQAAIADAKTVICLSVLSKGKSEEGQRMCEEAVSSATAAKADWLVSHAKLAYAEFLLQNKRPSPALEMALSTQEISARLDQSESTWKAWLIAARASHLNQDDEQARQYAAHALQQFDFLQQHWGANYKTYISRPDVQNARHQLAQLFNHH